MPDESTTLDLATPAGDSRNGDAPRRPIFPKRPKRHLRVDPEHVVDSCEKRVEQILDDTHRSEWMSRRLQRYRKYRGQLDDKTFPWTGASNVHPPLLQTAELRVNAGLHNVVMTLRPLLSAVALSRANVAREEKVARLIDYQLFVEPGADIAERRATDFVSNGCQDGNAVAYCPWVRDEQEIVSYAYRPALAEDAAPLDAIEEIIRGAGAGRPGLFSDVVDVRLDEKRDHEFRVRYRDHGRPRRATVLVFEDEEDGGLTLEIRREAVLYDGPIMVNVPIGSILVPTRAKNLQPPSQANPGGAGYVFLLCTYTLDDIRRLARDGTLNYLDAEGLEKIEAEAKTRAGAQSRPVDEQQLQQQKDRLEGREHSEATVEDPDEGDVGHLPVPCVLAFDRWDVAGDGLAEDVFWLYARDTKELLEGRRLVEKWPAVRPYRPLAEWCPIPVPDRWLGISLLELGESLYDLIKQCLDIGFDSGVLSNLPFGFYSAGSTLRQTTMSIQPGILQPVPGGDPRTSVYFPSMPAKDQTWAFNFIGLATQFFEKLMMIGGVQLGQVPTGKASALRTVGTTMALMQQGDVRADQLLLRLFGGLRQIALYFHRMNCHLLPDGKEIRIVGWDGEREQGYQTVERDDLDPDIDFDFRPDFLLSNPQALSETIASVLSVLVSPLMLELGIVNADKIYALAKDFVRAKRLDPKKYIQAPSETAENPIMAEEAIGMVLQSQMPQGAPMEGPEGHLKKLIAFVQSDEFGHLTPEQVELMKGWINSVGARLRQQKVVAAAGAFQQAQGGGPGMPGAGGQPTMMAEPPVQAPGPPGAGDPSLTGAEA